jgi:hypothetical protein
MLPHIEGPHSGRKRKTCVEKATSPVRGPLRAYGVGISDTYANSLEKSGSDGVCALLADGGRGLVVMPDSSGFTTLGTEERVDAVTSTA